MNRLTRLSLAIVFVIIFSGMAAFAKSSKFTVIIDAGHGGKDAGALGSVSQEKNITLAVAKKVGELIERNHPDVNVIYTRKSDVFVALDRRAEIANNAKADLFISIHCNAMPRNQVSPQGVETFILGLHRSQDNLEVAKKENSVILLEDDYSQKYAGFNPNEPESYIIFEYMSNQYLKQSLELASLVQRRIVNNSGRTNRNVRQAGFLVLREVAMPSILIELGYISNRSEEQYLLSTAGQNSLANSIYKAFSDYKRNFDKKTIGYVAKKGKEDIDIQPDSTDDLKADTMKKTKVEAEKGVANKTDKSLSTETTEYRVQFLTATRVYPDGSPQFKGLSPVSYYKDGSTYKYTYGSTSSEQEILRILKEVRSKFRDAFVVEFKNGIRVK
jgi:N-acetylmuramoyl-L-alanine amidase